MAKFIIRVKYAGGAAYHKHSFEAPDMEFAVKSGYDFAKAQNPGIPIMEFHITARD
jgi:hypothetical protein